MTFIIIHNIPACSFNFVLSFFHHLAERPSFISSEVPDFCCLWGFTNALLGLEHTSALPHTCTACTWLPLSLWFSVETSLVKRNLLIYQSKPFLPSPYYILLHRISFFAKATNVGVLWNGWKDRNQADRESNITFISLWQHARLWKLWIHSNLP